MEAWSWLVAFPCCVQIFLSHFPLLLRVFAVLQTGVCMGCFQPDSAPFWLPQQEQKFRILPCLGGQGLGQAWLGLWQVSLSAVQVAPGAAFPRCLVCTPSTSPRVQAAQSMAVLAPGCDEGLSPALWAWCGFSETTSLEALLHGAFLPPF